MKNNKFKNLICLSSTMFALVLASCGETTTSKPTTSTSSTTSIDPTTTTTTSTTTTTTTSTVPVPVDPIISGWSNPTFVTEWTTNKAVKENKREEFFLRDAKFLVGADNNWIYKPIASSLDDDNKEIVLENYKFTFKLFSINGTTEKELAQSEIVTFVDVNHEKYAYDFKELAIGKTFKLIVSPEDKLGLYGDSFQSKFIFDVVEGTNVYNSLELSYLDNVNPEWEILRERGGLSKKSSTKKIILQNSIDVEPKDLPQNLFWHAEPTNPTDRVEGYKYVNPADSDAAIAVGSMVDWLNIYERAPKANEDTFGVEGNYFKLNCSKLTNVVRPTDKIIWSLNDTETPGKKEWTFNLPDNPMSHAQLIFIGLQSYNTAIPDLKYTQNNLSIIGNDKVSGESQLGCGGIIYLKAYPNSHVTVTNNIAINWFISYMSVTECSKFIVDKTKGYDNYSSFFYNYGNKTTEVIDSEFENCGGPVFIANHVSPKDYGYKYLPKMYYTNTKSHSYLVGNEAWFVATGSVAYAGQVQQLAILLSNYGTMITKEINGVSKFDCAGIIKLDGTNAESSTTAPSSGLFVADTKHVIDYEDPTIKTVLNNPALSKAPVFVQPQTGVISYFNGTNLINPLNNNPTPLNGLNGGDYLTVYLPGGVGARISIVFNIQK
ncbi:MAG: hypothetical protein RSC27_03715 [Bacilli bacterium]